MATSATTETVPETAPSLETELAAPGLVFLGLSISWKRRPSDLRVNTTLAERWEGAFDDWSVDSRVVVLQTKQRGASVTLGDGFARFECQSGEGYRRVLELVPQLLETLSTGKREEVRALAEAQFLFAQTVEFGELLGRMSAHALNSAFLPSIGATLVDFAYLGDVVIKRQWYQLHFGPVRAHEIPMRVKATNIRDLPEVATFFNIATRWKFGAEPEELAKRIEAIIDVGNNASREIAK